MRWDWTDMQPCSDFVADVIDCVTRRHTLSRPLRARSSDKRDASVHGKTPTLYATVSQLVARAQEVADPREVYDNLKDLAKFPRKMLKFAEDLRPPYAGKCGSGQQSRPLTDLIHDRYLVSAFYDRWTSLAVRHGSLPRLLC